MKREFKGFIYKDKKGRYLSRHIERGYCDSTYYALNKHDDFRLCCLFVEPIDLTRGLKYRTLFAEEIIADCECIEVVAVSKGLEWEVTNV